MSFWEGIKDFFSGVSNAISKVISNSALMQTLLPVLTVVIPPPWDIVALVVVTIIAAAMGVEEEPDKLGWQMNEADKKPEDFDSFKEYKEYLDEEYPFNQDKFNAQTPEQKLACRYIGMAGTIVELKETNGFEITPETLGMLVKAGESLGWDNATLADFAKNTSIALNNNGLPSLSPLEDAVKGTLNPNDFSKVLESMETALKELPDENTKEVFDVISAMRDNENL